MYELDRLSRSVVVWLKEVRYPLAALQARGFRGGPEEGLCLHGKALKVRISPRNKKITLNSHMQIT